MAPIFDYANVVYNCLNARDSNTLQKIQNCALRIILQGDSRSHVSDMHKELKLNYLADRRHMHTLNQVYKCINDLSPTHVNNQISLMSTNHQMQTRSTLSHVAYVPNIRLEVCRKSFRYRGPCLWNIIDDEIKIKPSIDSFKRAVYQSDLFEVL